MAYHNWRHAFNVSQCMFVMITVNFNIEQKKSDVYLTGSNDVKLFCMPTNR